MRPVLILALLLAGPALAEPRPATGLLWNRSPLPATIPLQIVSQPGRDYAIQLHDPGGDETMAGYLRGGDFFRLLVPPGDYLLRIAAGPAEDWQGDEDLFGGATVWIGLDEPLRFRIAEGNRREGHRITLAEGEEGLTISGTQGQVICQIARWHSEIVEWPDREWPGREGAASLRYLDSRLTTRSRFCD